MAVGLAALVLSLALLSQGCGGGRKGGAISLARQASQDSFALYYPVPSATAARVAPYSVSADLSNVAGASAAPTDQEARRALAAHGFVAVAGSRGRLDLAYRDISAPKFVTLDAALFALHSLGSRILYGLERDVLAADLGELLRSMLEGMRGIYEEAGGAVREAASADLAYLGVASRLLGQEAELPREAAELAEKELELISGGGGEATSPLMGTRVDYGRFRPQERYGQGSGMEGYYQAVTWLGEIGFPVRAGGGFREIVEGRDMARRAVLLLAALHMAEADGKPALELWDRVYQVNAFLAGAASELNPYLLTRLVSEVYGTSFRLEDLEDDTALDELISLAVGEVGSVYAAGAGGIGAGDPPCFRLLGARPRLEDAVFPELVADKVPGRFLPRGLDLPAALGSERALRLLEEVYGEASMEGYGESMSGLREALAAQSPSPARTDLYEGMREALRGTLEPRGEGYPPFTRGTAWLDRCLYSFLASWVELERDDAAEAVGGAQGDARESGAGAAEVAGDKGYVEPLPAAYAELAALTDMLRRGLRERGLSDPSYEERLDALYGLLVTLKNVSEKELRNEVPTAEEYGAIASVGETLAFICSLPLDDSEGGQPSGDACACAVIDLYRDPVYGEVLQAATGRPVTYYVIAPVEGRPTLTVGAGFSYYEFARPADQRHTTSSWREAVVTGALPDPSAWTASFLP